MHLIMRGESTSTIRIVDFTPPSRPELLEVGFVKTDISDRSSVKAAFTTPWPSSEVSKLPLTVFHTAAVIRPAERSLLVWDRTSGVNVDVSIVLVVLAPARTSRCSEPFHAPVVANALEARWGLPVSHGECYS